MDALATFIGVEAFFWDLSIDLSDALAIFNSVEAVFWMTIGVTVYLKSRSSKDRRRLAQIAAVWFILFGVSDIFEVFTGAWWRPWPLLLFKAICVIALVSCGVVYRKTTPST